MVADLLILILLVLCLIAFGSGFLWVLLVIGIIGFALFVFTKIVEWWYDWTYDWTENNDPWAEERAERERQEAELVAVKENEEAKERLPKARQKAEELLGKARQKSEWGWTTAIEDKEIEALGELLSRSKHTGTYKAKEAVAKGVCDRLHELLYGRKNKNEDN